MCLKDAEERPDCSIVSVKKQSDLDMHCSLTPIHSIFRIFIE